MKHRQAAVILLAAALILSACATTPDAAASAAEAGTSMRIADLTPVNLADGERLRVVATTNLAADVLANIGGDDIQLTALLPIGADPHSFTPAPRDLQAVADADVLFVNGFGLEEGLADTLAQVAKDIPILSLSEGIEPRAFQFELAHEDDHDVGEEHVGEEHVGEEHEHTGADPHVWFNPLNVSIWADNAARALAALDPAHASNYAANAAVYQTELVSLDAWIVEQMDPIPADERRMVTDHGAFGYFADRYGVEIIGAVIPAYSTTASPSPQDIADLLAAIEAYEVRAVFVGVSVNPTLAERVSEDAGIELIPLYTGALSGPDGPANTYLDLMRYNVGAIADALRGEE